jgi:rhodanese-related sulfurtransferase
VRRFGVRSLVLAGVATLLVAACGGTSGTGGATLETVSTARAAEIIGEGRPGLVVLDVRTPEEFAAGHLANAVNLDFYNPGFPTALAALDRETPYVLYCRTDNRSAEVRELMGNLGFTEVYEIDGGIVAWAEEGRPFVRP